MASFKDKKVVTDMVRLSYVNVWQPRSVNGGMKKYSLCIIIPKSHGKTIEAIKRAVDFAIEEGISKYKITKVDKSELKLPLRDGDLKDDEEDVYRNSYFINASSITKPEIVDKSLRAIEDESEIYSGVYARVSMSFYPFNVDGKMGVACSLGNIQKLKDGEILSGKSKAEEDFYVID